MSSETGQMLVLVFSKRDRWVWEREEGVRSYLAEQATAWFSINYGRGLLSELLGGAARQLLHALLCCRTELRLENFLQNFAALVVVRLREW